jgi:tetratricopeptide (TPR) repeat protein
MLVLAAAVSAGLWLRAGEPDPNAATAAAYARSHELEAKRDYAEALKALQAVNPRDKYSYFFSLRTAWLSSCNGKNDEALLNYDKAAGVSVGAIEPLLGKLAAESALGKLEESEKTASAILRLDPKNYTARSTLAYSLFQRKRYRESQDVYEDILKLYPADLTMQAGQGWCLIWLGKRREAMKVFRDILDVSPNHDGALKALAKEAPPVSATATAYQRSYQAESEGNHAEALKALDALDGVAKSSYLYYLRCGWLNYLSGQHDKAAACYASASKFSPQAVQPLLGKLLPESALGKWDDVLKTADAALALDPRNYSVRLKQAYAYYSISRFQDAERVYRELAREYPGDLNAHSGLGWSLLGLDKKAEAVKEFKGILQVCPSHELANKGLEIAKPAE